MQNNIQNDYKSQIKNTWLQISFSDDISSELGNSIPYPHHHYLRNNKIVYCWLIDGFFDTLKGVQFLNDIIARLNKPVVYQSIITTKGHKPSMSPT